MKFFLTLFLFISGFFCLHAADIDMSASKGTDQPVIVQLSPSPAQMDVWGDAKIEAGFTVPLDVSAIQKHNVKLTHLSSKTNDHIAGSIDYNMHDNKLYFTPNAALPYGVYEVEIKSLKADKDHKATLIKEIKYRFYVPEVINGHQLPPEPDPAVNNSTLLGIDVNKNGVRDDVERYIILRYSQEEFPKTRTALAMQYAWAMQKIIENPTRKSAKYSNDAIDCQYYWFSKKQHEQKKRFSELLKTDRQAAFELDSEMAKWRMKYKVFNDAGINSVIFNTRERTRQDFAFNGAMSGGIYPGRNKSIDNCQTNIDLFGE
jgi:hypothetical protein